MLESLPSEILHEILSDVGSDKLRKTETCGLTVCKRWHRIAEPVLFEKLELSASQFMNLTRWPERSMKKYTKELTITVKGLESENKHWVDLLTRHLDRLGDILPTFSRLRSFNLRVQSHLDLADPLVPPPDFLRTWTPLSLVNSLSTSRIRHLEIDTCGSELQSTDHLCPILATEMPALVSLRLRMRTICPEIFSQAQIAGSTKIKNLVINLSHIEADGWPTAWSCRCGTEQRGPEIFEDMVEAGTAFARETESLQSLRIIFYFHPSLQMMEHDCVTGVERPLTQKVQDILDFDWVADLPA